MNYNPTTIRKQRARFVLDATVEQRCKGVATFQTDRALVIFGDIMRTGFVKHPANEPLIMIRKWQLEFCDGNVTAAALLSFLEYWHDNKVDNARQAAKANKTAEEHGDKPIKDTSLLQWHTEKDLITGLMGITKHPKTIRAALKVLEDKKVISIHKNPNPRYAFDSTKHFLFYPNIVNAWLDDYEERRKITSSEGKNASREGKNASREGKNASTSPEITPEITSENNMPVGNFDDFSDWTEVTPPSPESNGKEERRGIIPETVFAAVGARNEARAANPREHSVYKVFRDYDPEAAAEFLSLLSTVPNDYPDFQGDLQPLLCAFIAVTGARPLIAGEGRLASQTKRQWKAELGYHLDNFRDEQADLSVPKIAYLYLKAMAAYRKATKNDFPVVKSPNTLTAYMQTEVTRYEKRKS